MKVLKTLLLFQHVFGAVFCSPLYPENTEYFLDLIVKTGASSLVFDLPENKSEFEIGSRSTKMNDIGVYDFIIVGAGSAGSVIASRLSERNNWNILVLEAGGEENDVNSIPATGMFLWFSKMNWGYYSTPQTSCCLGMEGKRCSLPQGKSIGGSSAINDLMNVRGNARDYDKWAEMGNTGWSYEEVLPYFKKLENFEIEGDSSFHNKGGLLNVDYAILPPNLLPHFTKASFELNRTFVDYNGRQQLGDSECQLNIKHGKRQSTGTAYLENARDRKNLKVITKALVTKIVIDPESKVAQGVEFVTNDTKYSAMASKEIIVSAGAINSPQLLMLSGIGPRSHLEELSVPVIEDLPVGQNLMDHPTFVGMSFSTNQTTIKFDVKKQIETFLNGTGPLTSPLNVEGLGFVHAGDIPEDTPMILYALIPYNENSVVISRRVYNFNDELKNNYLAKLNHNHDFAVFMILLHPKSRGGVYLKSTDPIAFPEIDLNLFSNSEDIDNFIKGMEFIMNLAETKEFQSINTTFVDIPICKHFQRFSKDFWDCAIRHMSMTSQHLSGTCSMGSSKTKSVVDTTLKVHGIDKLRVVDASVFPSTLSGNTNVPVIMVAEKISDVIKENYKII